MKQALKFGTAAILLILTCAPTVAADDLTLVRILARADITQNFVFYCAQYDPSIIERTRSSVGDAQQLMLHIRNGVDTRRGSNRKLSRLCRRDLAYPRSTRFRCVAFSHRQTDDRKRIQFQNIEMELIAGRRTATVLSEAV